MLLSYASFFLPAIKAAEVFFFFFLYKNIQQYPFYYFCVITWAESTTQNKIKKKDTLLQYKSNLSC